MVKRGRRARGHEQRRERILSAARTLIAQRGYDHASLRGIAREAGFSPAGLYEYFEGREEILEALAWEAGARLQRHLWATLDDATGWAGDRLVRLGVAYIAFARERPEDFALLFSRPLSHDTGVARALSVSAGRPRRGGQDAGESATGRGPGAALTALVDVATAGLVAGEFDPLFSAEEIAWGLWSLAHGAASLQLCGLPPPEDAEAGEAWALRAYVDGLSV